MTDRSSERGTIALEFVLLLPVILLMVGTLVITGLRGVYSALGVHEARVAAREASIRTGQSPGDPYPTESEICTSPGRLLAFPGSDLIGCVVSNNSATGSDPDEGDVVTVTLTYQLNPLIPLSNFVAGSFNLQGLAVMSQSASVMRE